MENFEDIIFKKKKLKDLFSDIYENSKNKNKTIEKLIEQLSDQIVDVQSALVIVPLISSYLNVGVKNDDNIIKLTSIVQRALSKSVMDDGALGIDLLEYEQIKKQAETLYNTQNNEDKK